MLSVRSVVSRPVEEDELDLVSHSEAEEEVSGSESEEEVSAQEEESATPSGASEQSPHESGECC